MIFAGILAGGSGTRMKEKIPKQFLNLGTKPIIIHTIEQFLSVPTIDIIIVAVAKNWISHTKALIKEYCENDKIYVVQAGKDRNETIINICTYIQDNFPNKNNIIVTHDAVRPFVTQRIIKENVELCKKYKATDTVIPATDTIVKSNDGNSISTIPIRSQMYQGQTPQSFYVIEFLKYYNALTEDQKEILTDACKVYILKRKKVGLVMGESYNMKITTQYDLKLANLLINDSFKM